MKYKVPTVIDLFCGAGGMSTGFAQAGFDIILGVDNWPIAIRTFKENHPEAEAWCRDIRQIDHLPKADVMIGGPPCPDFSIAYKEKDPKRGLELVYEFLRCVKLVNPKYWIMENVPQITRYISKRDFPMIKVLNAADYGVPQKRNRCFSGKYVTPRQTHHERGPTKTLSGSWKKWLTLGEVLINLSEEDPAYFTEHQAELSRLHKQKHQEKGHGFGFQILDLSQPSLTITAHLSHGAPSSDPVFIENEKMRLPNISECKRIQTFPDDYIFAGNKKDQYRQIGNAVPPLLAKHLALAIKGGFA